MSRNWSEKQFTKLTKERWGALIAREGLEEAVVKWREAAHLLGFDVVGKEALDPKDCSFWRDFTIATIPLQFQMPDRPPRRKPVPKRQAEEDKEEDKEAAEGILRPVKKQKSGIVNPLPQCKKLSS
jgi:hypothetical protein